MNDKPINETVEPVRVDVEVEAPREGQVTPQEVVVQTEADKAGVDERK